MQAVQAYQGSELLLDWLGIFVRAPAVQATLCLAPEISLHIFNMLTTIRRAKGPGGTDMLKGSSLPLPRLEPWASTLKAILIARAAHSAPSIPQIVQRNAERAIDNISIRGQLGDGRDLKPNMFCITCPGCSAGKNVAKCTLYTTHARVLYCAACKISSSKWHCSHGLTWITCPLCREAGFRCGVQKTTTP